MPYIPKKEREKYDNLVDNLGHILNTRRDNDELSGELNYVLFRLAIILTTQEAGGVRSYARMAVVSSALAEAQAEFRRRVMAEYEDKKCQISGDVEV